MNRNPSSVALRTSREAGKFLAQLETLKSREKEIGDEGKSYKTEKENLEKQLENLPKLKTEIAETESEIKNSRQSESENQTFWKKKRRRKSSSEQKLPTRKAILNGSKANAV